MSLKNRCISIGVLIATAIFSFSAQAQNNSLASIYAPQIEWSTGHTVTVCGGASGARTCTSADMPRSVGSLSQLVVGEFVTPARASWIAVSKRAASLCAMPLDSSVVACKKIRGAHLEKIKLVYLPADGNKPGMLRFQFMGGTANGVKSLQETADAFLLHLDVARLALQVRMTNTQAPESEMRALSIEIGGDCGVETACDDGGGGGDDPIGGDVPIVVIPGDPPPLPSTDPNEPSDPIDVIGDGSGVDIPITPVGNSPERAQCHAKCAEKYDTGAKRCRSLLSSKGRALCWIAIAAAEAYCISQCGD